MRNELIMIPPWKQLRELAEPIDASCVLRMCEIESPVIPIKTILKKLGVKYETAQVKNWISALKCNDRSATIWVNVADSIEHQRFTAAHELGHLLLHQDQDHFECVDFAGSNEEIAANQFALELLIPIRPLRRNIRKMWKLNIVKLAELFRVPEGTIRMRIEQTAMAGDL